MSRYARFAAVAVVVAGMAAGVLADATVCDPSSTTGSWIGYTSTYALCGQFHLAWGNGGTDTARFDPNIPRDTYVRAEHRFTKRANGDTVATHSIVHDGGTSNVNVNQSGSGAVTVDLGDYKFSGNNDYWQVSSDGGGAMDTIADYGVFISLLDSTYNTREVHSSMYLGNVYYWKYRLNNVGDYSWATSTDKLNRTAGSITGPGWSSSTAASVSCSANSAVTIPFNVRPTSIISSQNQSFQMYRTSNTFYYGEEAGTNGNMAISVTTTRKAPYLHGPGDSGAKKKGETVRFYTHGSSSFTSYAYSWDWDGAYRQGWETVNQCTSTQEDSNNRIKIAVTGGDPYVISSPSLAINASQARHLAIRMWADGGTTAKLYWANEDGSWSEARQISWTFPSTSAWHDYHFDLATEGTGWSGTVNRLRLDVIDTGAASGQTAYVDYLRFYDESQLSAKIWLGTANNNWDIANTEPMTWDATNHYWYKDYTITADYPATYYCAMHVYNDDGVAHCENNTGRKYSDDTREYAIANTAPACSNIAPAGNEWTAVNNPTLQWSYTDADQNAQSDYRIQIDDDPAFGSPVLDSGDVASADDSFTAPALDGGQWHWRVMVKDGTDYSEWSTPTSFQVDADAPSGNITINEGAEYTNSAEVTLSLTASDEPGSGVAEMRFSNDSTEWSEWEAAAAGKSWTLDGGDGEKSVYVQFKDAVGNVSIGEISDSIVLDTTAPTLSVGSPSLSVTQVGPVEFLVSYSDAGSEPTVTLSVADITLNKTGTADGTISVAGTGSSRTVTISDIFGDGTLGISVAAGTATDAAGNAAETAGPSETFIVQGTPPEVTIDQAAAQADPTNVLPIYFDVVFSKDVTGFEVGDVSWTGTADGVTYAITGSGSSYTIEVTAVATPGTLIPIVPADVAQDIGGNLNVVSTSTDNEVVYTTAPNLAITGWYSIRVHGPSDEWDIALPADGVGCEPRRGGIQIIAIDFSEAAVPTDGTLDADDVTITDHLDNVYSPVSIALVDGDATLELEFANGQLPNKRTYTLDVAGKFKAAASGLPMSGDGDCTVRALLGDANLDGTVNLIDLALLKAANRTALAYENAALDLNTDGAIDMIDAAYAKAKLGHTAP